MRATPDSSRTPRCQRWRRYAMPQHKTGKLLPRIPSMDTIRPGTLPPRRRPRLRVSTADLDRCEANWWECNASVEEQFCWVQTPQVRTLLRAHYVRRIVRALPVNGRVLEIGCGTGWFSLLLAGAGASEVHGIDASAEQIKRARKAAQESGADARVHFHRSDDLAESQLQLAQAAPFDVVVIHAVFHHLSDDEVTRCLAALRCLAPDAQLFIVEPVCSSEAAATWRSRILAGLIDRLILLPRFGQRSGLRRFSSEEAEVQRQIDTRGDSPKETPFLPGELERLVSSDVIIDRTSRVLLFSYLAAKNLLLMQISYPRLASSLLLPYLRLVRRIEAAILARIDGPFPLPVFVMYEGRFAGSPRVISPLAKGGQTPCAARTDTKQ